MFTPLSSLVEGAIRRLGLERQLEAQAVVQSVNRYLAEALALGHAAHAYRYARGRVYISVDHPAVAALVNEQKEGLFSELRRRFPGRTFAGVAVTARRLS